MLNFFKTISTTEIVLIVLILVVLFGAKAIVKLGKTSGETVKEVKKIKKEFTKSLGEDYSESSK